MYSPKPFTIATILSCDGKGSQGKIKIHFILLRASEKDVKYLKYLIMLTKCNLIQILLLAIIKKILYKLPQFVSTWHQTLIPWLGP